jgi:hypothetical protein
VEFIKDLFASPIADWRLIKLFGAVLQSLPGSASQLTQYLCGRDGEDQTLEWIKAVCRADRSKIFSRLLYSAMEPFNMIRNATYMRCKSWTPFQALPCSHRCRCMLQRENSDAMYSRYSDPWYWKEKSSKVLSNFFSSLKWKMPIHSVTFPIMLLMYRTVGIVKLNKGAHKRAFSFSNQWSQAEKISSKK